MSKGHKQTMKNWKKSKTEKTEKQIFYTEIKVLFQKLKYSLSSVQNQQDTQGNQNKYIMY